mgnify:CR=1 FL=1
MGSAKNSSRLWTRLWTLGGETIIGTHRPQSRALASVTVPMQAKATPSSSCVTPCAWCWWEASRRTTLMRLHRGVIRAAMTRRVYVTGMGAVSALGMGRRPYWDALRAGTSAAL